MSNLNVKQQEEGVDVEIYGSDRKKLSRVRGIGDCKKSTYRLMSNIESA